MGKTTVGNVEFQRYVQSSFRIQSGAAGVYALTQPHMSRQLLDVKMREVMASGAGVIATANPGCMAQLEAGLRRQRLPGRVAHVIELLDDAYRAG